MSLLGDGNFFGTVDSSGCPVSYVTGFGGIKDAQDIAGSLILSLGSKEINFSFTAGDDVAYLAQKIKDKMCNRLTVVNGIELGITIETATEDSLTITVYSKEFGNMTDTFNVIDDSDSSYESLMNSISNIFEAYICTIWYDSSEKLIRIIFNAGYTVGFSSLSANTFTFITYLNGEPINTGSPSDINEQYAYGYLEFYSICESYIVEYPTNSLETTTVTMTSFLPSQDCFCQNVTLDLTNVWCCRFETIATICVRYDRSSKNLIEIKAFYSWGLALKNLIKCIDFNCEYYGTWRRNNVIASIESLIKLLDNLIITIENQKDLIKISLCDYIKYECNCGKYSGYSRNCC